MLWIIRFFKTFLANAGAFIAGWFGQALVVLGVMVVSTQFALEPIMDLISNNLAGAPLVMLQVIGYTHTDIAMTMILTALAARGLGKLALRKRPAAP